RVRGSAIFFFFQAEDGIRDGHVTGVQTCALPIFRRRRECLGCQRRFTTYERVEEILPMVVKKDGRREAFDRQKVLEGLKLACQKRPVGADQLEAVVDGIERRLQEMGEKEVPSSVIGEAVMRELARLDEVAYVRFASVYRSFKDLGEFMSVIT